MFMPRAIRTPLPLQSIVVLMLIMGGVLGVIPAIIAYGFEQHLSLGTLIVLHISIIIAPLFIKVAYILHLTAQRQSILGE